MDFIEENGWVLPTSGTLGTKAQNLYDNREIIAEHGFLIPRSLVVPYECLQMDRPDLFVLDRINEFFPNWNHLAARSSAPDEDVVKRSPGLYRSEHLSHNYLDRGALHHIRQILGSYDCRPAQVRRQTLGQEQKGMSLLIQEIVSNTEGKFDASDAGAFSDVNEGYGVLQRVYPHKGLHAMQGDSSRKFFVLPDGNLEGPHRAIFENNLVQKLNHLCHDLPQIPSKGWELEYVVNYKGAHIVQTTPIHKSKETIIPEGSESIFDERSVIGSGSFATNGILYVPALEFNLDDIIIYDASSSGYCLVVSDTTTKRNQENPLLPYLTNASAIIDLGSTIGSRDKKLLAAHLGQYLREGRIGLSGVFIEGELATTLLPPKNNLSFGYPTLVSETSLQISADERKGWATIAVNGDVKPFTSL